MEENKKIFYGWWIVLGSILITATVVPSVMAMAGKFTIPVITELGITRTAFTLGNSLLHAMGIFFSPFITKKLAKGNMKKIQSISIVLFAITFATYGLANKPIHFYISSVILGILYLNTSLIPVSMMINNWFEEKRGLAMSLAMTGIGVGGFIFSPLITSLIGNFGWRNTYFIFAAIILVISLPISLFVFAKSPEDKGLKPYGFKSKDQVERKSSVSLKQEKFILTKKESFIKPFFILMIVGMVTNGLVSNGGLGQFPPALEELHGPAVQAIIVSLYSVFGIFGKLFIGWINDRFGLVQASFVGCITFAMAFACMLFAENITVLYIMTVFFGIGMAIGTVLPPLITSAIFGQKRYGEFYGYVSSATQVGLSLGSLLVASIFDLTNTYKIAWIVLIILTLLTLFCWIVAYKASFKYKKITE